MNILTIIYLIVGLGIYIHMAIKDDIFYLDWKEYWYVHLMAAFVVIGGWPALPIAKHM